MPDASSHVDSHPSQSSSDSKEKETIDFNTEYSARFAVAKRGAESRGLRYEHPSRAGIGWKIHLAVSDSPQDPLTSRIAEYIKSKRFLFKIGSGGTTEDGKGMTIYIGDRDTMEDFAGELHTNFGQEIPEQRGDALQTDMPVIGSVWARFENVRDPRNREKIKYDTFGETTEDKYLQYGLHGVPTLREDAMKALWGGQNSKLTGQQMRERAASGLMQDYGAFFSGTRNHPV